ncbi:MAG: FAD-dependent oxidoreductase [Chloroflexi bacterium]|nr:FAD-dependent oxidoreductase [Chloroflexota bacterium]
MRRGDGATIQEPARQLPVYGACEVLVVGGGPAGTAAAIAAARAGAETVLAERYGYLGGLSTGGLVCWIDRMADWDGRLVVGGIGKELMDACAAEEGGLVGPPREQWGSHDPEAVAYWAPRSASRRGVVTWTPTIDPEILKGVSNDKVRQAGAQMLLHCWAVGPAMIDGKVGGAIFESKEGRFAVLADVTIDCTGDGDIFAGAGAPFESDVDASTIHALMNTSCRFGNVDTETFFDFQTKNPSEFSDLLRQAEQSGVHFRCGPLPQSGQSLCMHPKLAGYSPLKVADLTEAELRSREAHRAGLQWWREHMPGWQHAILVETAPQVGVRHSRRLAGVTTVTMSRWREGILHEDGVGLCPGPSPQIPTLQIPLGSLIPRDLDGMLVAGRNLSCDVQAHNLLREIPECWVMGEAAGSAAALAVRQQGVVREVDVPALQDHLREAGALVDVPR